MLFMIFIDIDIDSWNINGFISNYKKINLMKWNFKNYQKYWIYWIFEWFILKINNRYWHNIPRLLLNHILILCYYFWYDRNICDNLSADLNYDQFFLTQEKKRGTYSFWTQLREFTKIAAGKTSSFTSFSHILCYFQIIISTSWSICVPVSR